ncbi:MAG: methyltransferase domain-containing protein [Rhodocyclaceae bacterium]|nr:methyltransferase domain-containing protein [Rhodocyclaceae bacterium]
MSFDPDRHKREERAGYNLIAARYAEGAALRSGLNAALLAAADLRPGQRVLDLASGPGVLAGMAAEAVRGGLVVASDIAEGALQEGRRRAVADNLVFAVADAERLTFCRRRLRPCAVRARPDVLSRSRTVFAEMRRVLKPGGIAVFSVWGRGGARATGVLRPALHPPHPAAAQGRASVALPLRQRGFPEANPEGCRFRRGRGDPSCPQLHFRVVAGLLAGFP